MAQKGAAVRQEVGPASVRSVLLVPVPVERAFEVFAEELADWWIRDYTWSGSAALVELGIEPHTDGMLYEIGPYGFRADWGRVLVWEPPYRLVFTWQIGPDRAPVPDPERASEVEVRFRADDSGDTVVEVEHRHFERHGESGEGYRQALTAGWQELLTGYHRSVTR
ncbi:SRPBCC family protein [Micromonospora sp. SH-82]|uniref:SRPBCC family protein n=1 Tax=Micromonospora sp. SH-82 TaxID=3132938 RepID=UPI003EBCECFD